MKSILEKVLFEMQFADEIGGPEDLEYVRLMMEIASIATERAKTCIDNMKS